MADWQNDKAKTDQVLPVVKRILGEHLISAAPVEEDAERNTDLIVLRLAAVRIGVRIRSAAYWQTPIYRQQFTIRAGRPSGHKTELAKILEGWGDYFFYGFANADYTALLDWHLCDLRVFRLWFHQQTCQLPAGKIPGLSLANTDGSSNFLVFAYAALPEEFITAKEVQP